MAGQRPVTPGNGSASLVVRAACPADVDRLLEIDVAAFPDPRPIEVRRRVFLHNRLGGLEHLRVVEQGAELLGHAFSFPVAVWFGGRKVSGRAIASVGVAVESRGRGVAGALLRAIHAEAADRGDAFTLLYPFRQGFYARLGYAPLAGHRVVTVSPRAIPGDWRDAAPGTLRRADGRDWAELERVYRAAARVGTGFVERSQRMWDHDFLEERQHWIVLEEAGVLRGYVSFRLLQTEPHARVRADVRELVAPDDAARRRLFAALGALGDQVGDVTIALAGDDPFDWAFLDGDRDRPGTKDVEHAQGVVNTGPMIRLVDVRRALLARGYAEEGSLELGIGEEPPFTLRVGPRAGEASVVESGEERAPRALRMSASTLASVAFGGLRLEDAVRLGWLGTPDAAAVRVGSALLRLPAFFSADSF